jgi:hypothetical protein
MARVATTATSWGFAEKTKALLPSEVDGPVSDNTKVRIHRALGELLERRAPAGARKMFREVLRQNPRITPVGKVRKIEQGS